MLVKFDSEVGSFSMDGKIAVQLLQTMGHSGTVPGAMLPRDIPGALAKLKDAVGRSPKASGADANRAEDEGREPPVSLHQRAYPLIDLLTRAAEQQKEVLWK